MMRKMGHFWAGSADLRKTFAYARARAGAYVKQKLCHAAGQPIGQGLKTKSADLT